MTKSSSTNRVVSKRTGLVPPGVPRPSVVQPAGFHPGGDGGIGFWGLTLLTGTSERLNLEIGLQLCLATLQCNPAFALLILTSKRSQKSLREEARRYEQPAGASVTGGGRKMPEDGLLSRVRMMKGSGGGGWTMSSDELATSISDLLTTSKCTSCLVLIDSFDRLRHPDDNSNDDLGRLTMLREIQAGTARPDVPEGVPIILTLTRKSQRSKSPDQTTDTVDVDDHFQTAAHGVINVSLG